MKPIKQEKDRPYLSVVVGFNGKKFLPPITPTFHIQLDWDAKLISQVVCLEHNLDLLEPNPDIHNPIIDRIFQNWCKLTSETYGYPILDSSPGYEINYYTISFWPRSGKTLEDCILQALQDYKAYCLMLWAIPNIRTNIKSNVTDVFRQLCHYFDEQNLFTELTLEVNRRITLTTQH